jgi:hypothetical protein
VIYVGIDDTDVLDSPGTVQLARHIVQQLTDRCSAHLITRHQLLDDPRVPMTKRNGCVAISFKNIGTLSIDQLAAEIQNMIIEWAPVGADPGLCIINGEVPKFVTDFGFKCKHELVDQEEAIRLADQQKIFLSGLGGTNSGVIGALAAIGLMNSNDDGRVIWVGGSEIDHYNISGVQRIADMPRFAIDEVRRVSDNELIATGSVDVGKRLRPNFRNGKIVLYVTPHEDSAIDWCAERQT